MAQYTTRNQVSQDGGVLQYAGGYLRGLHTPGTGLSPEVVQASRDALIQQLSSLANARGNLKTAEVQTAGAIRRTNIEGYAAYLRGQTTLLSGILALMEADARNVAAGVQTLKIYAETQSDLDARAIYGLPSSDQDASNRAKFSTQIESAVGGVVGNALSSSDFKNALETQLLKAKYGTPTSQAAVGGVAEAVRKQYGIESSVTQPTTAGAPSAPISQADAENMIAGLFKDAISKVASSSDRVINHVAGNPTDTFSSAKAITNAVRDNVSAGVSAIIEGHEGLSKIGELDQEKIVQSVVDSFNQATGVGSILSETEQSHRQWIEEAKQRQKTGHDIAMGLIFRNRGKDSVDQSILDGMQDTLEKMEDQINSPFTADGFAGGYETFDEAEAMIRAELERLEPGYDEFNAAMSKLMLTPGVPKLVAAMGFTSSMTAAKYLSNPVNQYMIVESLKTIKDMAGAPLNEVRDALVARSSSEEWRFFIRPIERAFGIRVKPWARRHFQRRIARSREDFRAAHPDAPEINFSPTFEEFKELEVQERESVSADSRRWINDAIARAPEDLPEESKNNLENLRSMVEDPGWSDLSTEDQIRTVLRIVEPYSPETAKMILEETSASFVAPLDFDRAAVIPDEVEAPGPPEVGVEALEPGRKLTEEERAIIGGAEAPTPPVELRGTTEEDIKRSAKKVVDKEDEDPLADLDLDSTPKGDMDDLDVQLLKKISPSAVQESYESAPTGPEFGGNVDTTPLPSRFVLPEGSDYQSGVLPSGQAFVRDLEVGDFVTVDDAYKRLQEAKTGPAVEAAPKSKRKKKIGSALSKMVSGLGGVEAS